MRRADVLVVMHGGDSLNGLHLRPGHTLVELVNCGFQLAHWEWLDTHKMVLTPVVRYERLVLPPTPRLAQMMGNMTAVVSDHPRRRSGRPVRVKSFYSIARVLYVVILYIIFRKYDDRDAESCCSMCSSFCGASVASSRLSTASSSRSAARVLQPRDVPLPWRARPTEAARALHLAQKPQR